MIEILPESTSNILAVKASEKLSGEDYEKVFIPALEKLINQYGKIRAILILAENFQGWELEAMWDDAKFGIRHREDFEKIAIVGGPTWIEWATNIGSYFIEGQVKTFVNEETQQALSWIAE